MSLEFANFVHNISVVLAMNVDELYIDKIRVLSFTKRVFLEEKKKGKLTPILPIMSQ